MAEVKKVVLLNRGKRHYDLKSGRVSPGEMVEVSVDEAVRLLRYSDLADASKLKLNGGASSQEVSELKTANASLADENAKLKEQLVAAGAPKEEKKRGAW